MAKGIKTGGRQKGTPNRATDTVREILQRMKCDPIRGMAKIAMDEESPPDLRGRMYSELSSYIYPKRKAIEVSGEVSIPGLTEALQAARQRVQKAGVAP